MVTRDFRRVLELRDLDAVLIATPDHWHALQMVMACQAGKDVFVQKPLATSIGEGRLMVTAARKYNRVVQVGTQQRSGPHYREAVEYVRSGKLGKIRLVRTWAFLDTMGEVAPVADSVPSANVDYDLWLGPARLRPFNKNRFHFAFRWYWDYSGGLVTDWGTHMIDIAMWALGLQAPISVTSSGGKYAFPDDAKETPDTQQVLFEFPGLCLTWEHAMGIGRGPESRAHGVAFYGHNGTLVVDRQGWEVLEESAPVSGKGRQKRMDGLPRRKGVVNPDDHLKNFIDCMRTRGTPNSDIDSAHSTALACHAGNIAFRTGRKLLLNSQENLFAGDAEAQKLESRTYRAPWKLVL